MLGTVTVETITSVHLVLPTSGKLELDLFSLSISQRAQT